MTARSALGYVPRMTRAERTRRRHAPAHLGAAGLRAVAFTALLVALAGGALWWQANRHPPAIDEPEAPREAMVLKDGRLHLTNATTPFTGQVTERYPDGVLRSRSRVRDGRPHGESRGWYPNGQLQVLEHFEDGVSHGLRLKWHDNGQKQSEAPVVHGVIEGTFRRWHPDASLAEEIPMKAGKPDGWAKAFHPDGSLKAEALMNSGQVVTQRFFNPPDPGQSPGDRPPLKRAGD